jgi:ABC-type antimicrobial peptide transport system permease subunit
VVGLVGNVKHGSLHEPAEPEFYQPYRQTPWIFMTIVARTTLPSHSVAETLRHDLSAVDPSLPMPPVRAMSDLIESSWALDRFQMIGLLMFGVIALTLAGMGLYGVLSYLVSRRTREIGLRIALGASRLDIVGLVLGDGLRLTMIGIVIGLAGAIAAGRAIRGRLFGVGPVDPATVGIVTLLVVGVSLIASYLPARRAMKVAPMAAVQTD